MRELLVRAGFEESGPGDIADIYIVNTCTVTGEADRESRSALGHFHKANPDARIVVTGCMAENDASALSSLPGVSDVLKNSEKNRIARVVSGCNAHGSGPGAEELSVSDFKDHSKAYVKIQDGCDNRCSYCKVPLVRGRSKSRPIEEIVREVDGLVRNGFKEIVLTGICLGAWGREMGFGSAARSVNSGGTNLVDALKTLDKIVGDFRIRLSSIEPKYVTDELIDFMAGNKRMCAHLHIPFQSGDDDVLRLMNRPYTSAEYRAIADRVRARMPHIALTTDILIGFPGESDARFGNTMAFVKAVAPSRTHIFTFSRREDTPAYDMPDTAERSVLRKRYDSMKAAAFEAAYMYKRGFIGKELRVLVETIRDGSTGLLKGYSDNYIQIQFAGDDDIMRNVVTVKVVGLDPERVMGAYGR